MTLFKTTIRYILSIGAVSCIIGACIEGFEWHLLGFLGWASLFYSVLVDFPAMVLFPIVTVCNYFITKKFWSVFKTEYYFWFARLGLYVLLILIQLIAEHLKR